MLVPRLIIQFSKTTEDVIEEGRFFSGMGLYPITSELDRESALDWIHQIKIKSLSSQMVLLTDDVELAALTNADGVCCDINDQMHGRAKDVLGEDKLVGGRASSIQEVADLFEEGMIDFIILGSINDTGGMEPILGKRKVQSIIDDARIMGYDIPIILEGGIDGSNVGDALSTGAYGILTTQWSQIETLKQELLKFPVR